MKGNSYFSRKLHSLLGIIPLGGVYRCACAYELSSVRAGTKGSQAELSSINSLPFLPLARNFRYISPAIFHGIYGLYVAYQSEQQYGAL